MVDFNKQFGKPHRIYEIPAKIRLHPKTFQKFKHWVGFLLSVVTC